MSAPRARTPDPQIRLVSDLVPVESPVTYRSANTTGRTANTTVRRAHTDAPVLRAAPKLYAAKVEAMGQTREIHDVAKPEAGEPVVAGRRRSFSQMIRQVSEESVLVSDQPVLTPDTPIMNPEESVLIPLDQEQVEDDPFEFNSDSDRVDLIATGAKLQSVLKMIAEHHGLNLVLGPEVKGSVTVSIQGAHYEDVLDAILGVSGFSWHTVDKLLYVTKPDKTKMDVRVHGKTLQVYKLNYVAATDVEAVANRLLSPFGTVFVTESDSADQLKTRELLVVDDTEAGHARIAAYIAQIDQAPRQVLVEAHVLQISLDEEERHGINLRSLARLDGGSIEIQGKNFADDGGNDPSLILRVNGKDMQSLIELIRSNTNSRTLASPKLSVVNRQEARIQIGQRLPYSVATTTQTTTIQSVEFLDVGIVLTVQPVITADGNVLMTVAPKVSGGKITESGFPEEDTTEVETTILLPDGGGVILGGLIREDDLHARSIVPGVDKVPLLGRLFRKKVDDVRRNELVVALVTHVMPDACPPRQQEQMELETALPPYASSELRHHQVPHYYAP